MVLISLRRDRLRSTFVGENRAVIVPVINPHVHVDEDELVLAPAAAVKVRPADDCVSITKVFSTMQKI